MKNYKISHLFLFAVLLGLIYSCKKEDDSNEIKTPEPLSVDKTCINVGMEDTLWVSLPAHVGGATAYEWTATCSDGSDVKINPDANDLSIMVTTSKPTYGSQLIVSVKAKNADEYSPARELTMNIEGVGIDYSLGYLNVDILNYVVLESANPPYMATVSDVNLPNSVGSIQWYRWVGSAYIQDDGAQPKLAFTPSINPRVVAILTNTNQCKSRIEYIHPKQKNYENN